MKLDSDALEAAQKAAYQRKESLGEAVYQALEAYLEHPAADLVPRKQHDARLMERDDYRKQLTRVQATLAIRTGERDEARREAEELKTDIISYIKVASDQAKGIVEQSQHQAALCDVLTVCEHICSNTVADYDNPKGHKAAHREAARRARAVLTNTAEAAAGYQKVPKRGFVGSRSAELGPIDPSLHSKPNKCYSDDELRELLAATPDPEKGENHE